MVGRNRILQTAAFIMPLLIDSLLWSAGKFPWDCVLISLVVLLYSWRHENDLRERWGEEVAKLNELKEWKRIIDEVLPVSVLIMQRGEQVEKLGG